MTRGGGHVHVFQILFQRVVDPNQGQRLLSEMREQLKFAPASVTWQVVKIENVNRFGNPFPVWLAKLLSSVGCEFEDINMVYQVVCDKKRAYELREWFENMVRPWASSDRRWREYMEHINSRVLDVSSETAFVYDSF